MLERYTRQEMAPIWTLENRFSAMLKVEKAVAKAQAEMGLIPSSAGRAILKRAYFKLKSIQKREKKTRHDVTAFVEEVISHVGQPAGSYLHWGLTSSDVLDTALSLQLSSAGEVLETSWIQLEKALSEQGLKHAHTLCCGRTHGIRAEPLSFGLKLTGFLLELDRNRERVCRALKQAMVGKISGAVGAYSTLPPQLEKKVCQALKLTPEPLSTQVLPRDRHAELILSLALTASGLERLGVEIRHLQRSEVGEVAEPFGAHQTGSSAMPHKKNPIYSENVTGLARLIRSYTIPALENIALWHERDISHSSVERVILPSAFILCDFALNRMAEVVKNLKIDKNRMLENLNAGGGTAFSSLWLTALIQKGMPRSVAYKLIQQESLSLQPKESLRDRLSQNTHILKYLNIKEIHTLYSLEKQKKKMAKRVQYLLKSRKCKGA